MYCIVLRYVFRPSSIPAEILHPSPPLTLEPGVGFVIGEEEVRVREFGFCAV